MPIGIPVIFKLLIGTVNRFTGKFSLLSTVIMVLRCIGGIFPSTSKERLRFYIVQFGLLKRRLYRVPIMYVLSKNKENITKFHLRIVKYRRILHRHVDIMFFPKALASRIDDHMKSGRKVCPY